MRLTDREILRALHEIDSPVSQDELAAMLGCHRNTVNKAIKRLAPFLERERLPNGKKGANTYSYVIKYHELPDTLRMELDP